MTKAAAGVACAMLGERTCRSAAHCPSTYPRQLEPSGGSALLAAAKSRRLSAGGRFPGHAEHGQQTVGIAVECMTVAFDLGAMVGGDSLEHR